MNGPEQQASVDKVTFLDKPVIFPSEKYVRGVIGNRKRRVPKPVTWEPHTSTSVQSSTKSPQLFTQQVWKMQTWRRYDSVNAIVQKTKFLFTSKNGVRTTDVSTGKRKTVRSSVH